MEKEVLVEMVKIVPSVLWMVFAGVLVFAFRNVIRTDLLPRITNLKALGVEATFVKNELDRVAKNSDKKIAGSEENRSQVARRAERIKALLKGSRILLVNDIPQEMYYVTNILRELGVKVTIEKSTSEALSQLKQNSFDVVISDMRRGDRVDAGVDFLVKSREKGFYSPTIFSVGQYEPERGVPPYAFGITNRVDELMNLVFDVIERQKG